MKKQLLDVHCWHHMLVVLLCGLVVGSIPATASGEQTLLSRWTAITPQTISGEWVGLKSSKMVVSLTVTDVAASADSAAGQRFEITAESTTYSLSDWTQSKGKPPEPMAYGQRIPSTKYKGYIEPGSRLMVLTKVTTMQKRNDGYLHEVEPEIIYGVVSADNSEIAGQIKTSARARSAFVVTRAKNAKLLIGFYADRTATKASGKVPKDEALIAWTEDAVNSDTRADLLRKTFSPGTLRRLDISFWTALMDDAKFVKVFGCKFDEMPARRAAAISQRLMAMQRSGKTGILNLASVAENLFPNSTISEAQIEARANRNIRAWKDAVFAELKSDEISSDTAERIASIERAADKHILDSLPEAERLNLFTLAHDASKRKSGDALELVLSKLEAATPSRPLLDELLFWEVSNDGLLRDKSKDRSAYRERLLRKIDATIESLLAEHDRRLAAVPGGSLIREIGWYADLVADLGTVFTRPPIQKRLDTLAARRNRSAAAAADGMLKQLRTARTASQVDSILTTSFRIPGDSVLPAAIPVFDAAHARKAELAGTQKVHAGQTLGPDESSILENPKVRFDNEVVARLFRGEFAMLKEDIAEGEYARTEDDLLGKLGFVPDYEFAVLAFCKYSEERCGTRTVGPPVKLKYTSVMTTTLGPWGPVINREEHDLGEITLPAAMAGPYDGVSRRAGILMLLSRGSMLLAAKQVMDDIRGFYDVWEPQSAGIAQLQDNLSRYWNRQSSLQEEFDARRPWPLRLERAVRQHASGKTLDSRDAAITDPVGVLTVFGQDLSVRDQHILCDNYSTANLILAALKLGRLDDLTRCLEIRGTQAGESPIQSPGANDVVSLRRKLPTEWFFDGITRGAVRLRMTQIFDTYADVGTKVKSWHVWNAFEADVIRGGTFATIQQDYAERFKKLARQGRNAEVGTYNLEMAWQSHASGILERPLTRGDHYLLWLMLTDPREGQGAYDSPRFAEWLDRESSGITAQTIREATYNRLYLIRKGKTPSQMNQQIAEFVLANKIPRAR